MQDEIKKLTPTDNMAKELREMPAGSSLAVDIARLSTVETTVRRQSLVYGLEYTAATDREAGLIYITRIK